MFLIAVSRNGIFHGTILFKGIGEGHPEESYSADCEGTILPVDTLQFIACRLKQGEQEGLVDGYEWNVQDHESIVWRPD